MSLTDRLTHPDSDLVLDEERVGALAGRLFEASLSMIELLTVYLGIRLSAYAALTAGPVTAVQPAERTGLDARYAREWLEQQTVAGILHCDDPSRSADERRYSLPAEHAVVLLDAEHPACSGPLALAAAGIAGVLPELIAAYRTGDGIPYTAYGADFRDGQAGFNRPAFHHLLAGAWLADGAPDVDARLREGGRVADLACGAGWSSIALARAYAGVTVDGFDVDEASIADARRNAARTGLSDRVRFEVLDVTDPASATRADEGAYQLVTVFEAVHDMARPVEALTTCRRLCAPGGAVLVMDERVADAFDPQAGPIERFLYGASVLHCLPVGRTEPQSAATGTIMRPETMRAYAAAAGFAEVEVLPIDHDLFRFYRLRA